MRFCTWHEFGTGEPAIASSEMVSDCEPVVARNDSFLETVVPFTVQSSVQVTFSASDWLSRPSTVLMSGSALSVSKNDGSALTVIEVGSITVLVGAVQVGKTFEASSALLPVSQPVTDWAVAALATPPPAATAPATASPAAAAATAILLK